VKFIVQMTHHADVDREDLSIGERSKEWVRQQKSAGRIDCAYAYAGGGGVGIINANSIDEVEELLRKNPGSPFLTWEVRELVEFD
jgi:hypothetical protein